MPRRRLTLALAGLLVAIPPAAMAGDGAPPPPPPESLRFTHGVIPPIPVAAAGHVSAVRNGVRFDVHFADGPKAAAVVYAVNTGRRQLVLTPQHHAAILDDLVRRKFTVIVADFRDKSLAGVDLEKYIVRLTADAREAADGVLPPKGPPRPAPGRPMPTSKTGTYAADYYQPVEERPFCGGSDPVIASSRHRHPNPTGDTNGRPTRPHRPSAR